MTANRLAILAAAAFVPWMALVFLFMEASGDEGAYHYQALMMARGAVPVLDYYQQHMPWASIPFALTIKLLSPALEAARLWSWLAYLAGLGLVWAMARRAWGVGPAAVATTVTAVNTYWLYANLEVGHSATANLALLTAAYLSTGPAGTWRTVLLGLALGVMVNARVVLVPLAAVLVILALIQADAGTRRRAAVAVIAGGVAASLPALALMAADTEAFFFNFLLGRLEAPHHAVVAAAGEGAGAWLGTRMAAVADLFTPGYLQRSGLPNLLILAMAATTVAICGTRRHRLARDPLMRLSGLVILAVLVSYSLADRVNGSYFHHWIPFLALMVGGAVHALPPAPTARRRWAVSILVVLVLAETAWWGAVTGVAVMRRSEPGATRPLAVAQIACWLDRHTPPDAVVMSYLGGPVAAADRRLPAGFEQAVGLIGLYWEGRLPEDRAARFHILTLDGYLDALVNGRIAAVVADSGQNEISAAGLARIEAAMAGSGLTPIGRLNGYPLWAAPGLMPPAPLRSAKPDGSYGEIARRRGPAAALGELSREVAASTADLPADMAAALARMVKADWTRRCGPLVR